MRRWAMAGDGSSREAAALPSAAWWSGPRAVVHNGSLAIFPELFVIRLAFLPRLGKGQQVSDRSKPEPERCPLPVIIDIALTARFQVVGRIDGIRPCRFLVRLANLDGAQRSPQDARADGHRLAGPRGFLPLGPLGPTFLLLALLDTHVNIPLDRLTVRALPRYAFFAHFSQKFLGLAHETALDPDPFGFGRVRLQDDLVHHHVHRWRAARPRPGTERQGEHHDRKISCHCNTSARV